MEDKTLYPQIQASDYRLNEISTIKKRLEKEISDRLQISNKYKKSLNIIRGTDITFCSIGAGLGISSVVLMTTGIASPIALSLCIISAGIAGIGVSSKFVQKYLNNKVSKHERIETVAKTKLDSITDMISNALENGDIDSQEFKLILDEIARYEKLKKDIRKEIRAKNQKIDTAEEKKLLIEQGRQEILKKIQQVGS